MLSALVFVLMLLSAFLTALLAVTFYWASVEVRARRAGSSAVIESGGQRSILVGENLSTIGVWRVLLERFSHMEELRRHIAEANLRWSVGRVTLLMLLGGSATSLLLWQVNLLPLPLCALIVSVVVFLPYVYISAARRRRFAQFAAQFPEALDSLTRALKSGYPLAAAIELLAVEQSEPLAGEMRRTRDEWNLGGAWDHALDGLANRIPLVEVRLFVAAVKLQHRAGGRLNDVLSRLSETMRENAALESEVRSVSAHSRITGLVLTALPAIIALLMFAVNPEYMAVLLRRQEGRTMLGAVVVANIAAHFLIKRIARVKM